MKLNSNIEINLFEVFKSGKIDFIRLGKDKNWILNNFPKPDDYGDGENLESATIWRYGNIEFHFKHNILTQIYTDYIDTLDGGKNITLDKWIFEKPKQLTITFVTKQLIEHHINFYVENKITEFISQTTIWLPNSNVYLNFQPIEKQNANSNGAENISPTEYKLCSFTITSKEK